MRGAGVPTTEKGVLRCFQLLKHFMMEMIALC